MVFCAGKVAEYDRNTVTIVAIYRMISGLRQDRMIVESYHNRVGYKINRFWIT